MSDVRDAWALAVQTSADLSEPAKLTAWVLREHANKRGEASCGVRKIAARRLRSVSTIAEHLHELEAKGFVQRLAGLGVKAKGGTTSLSRLVLPESVRVQSRTLPRSQAFGEPPVSSGKRSGPGTEQNQYFVLNQARDARDGVSGAVAHDAQEPPVMSTTDFERKAAQLAADWRAAHVLFRGDSWGGEFSDDLIAEATGVPLADVTRARKRYRARTRRSAA